MADVARTCANCGNSQAAGDFCEKCGTRMPAAAAAAAPAAAYSAPSQPAPGAAAPPPPYMAQAPYGATPPPGAPQYGYVKESGPWSRLFDFSFQGFVTPSTLKTLYVIVLGLIGLYVLFNIILVAMGGNRFFIISFFISVFAAALWFFLSRVLFELMATIMRVRDKAEGN